MNPGPSHASGELVRAYASSDARLDAQPALIAQGDAMRALLSSIAELAPSRDSVLICGETGTGKTLIAHELCLRSTHAEVPRILNCAALPDALLAEVLARLDLPLGGGPANAELRTTILLDEVGELSPWGQAVVLGKLNTSSSCGFGARFLAATHRDLDVMASAGSFSRELLRRLSAHRLVLAPLRARREEIAPLAFHFLRLALRTVGKSFVSVAADFVGCLEGYDWPGNIRELNNAMLGVLTVNESGTLSPSDLPDAVRAGALAPARVDRR